MTLHRRAAAWLLLALSASLLSCARDDGAFRYPLKGKIESLDLLDREITVAHEDIPGFMPAMTMPFRMPAPQGTFANLTFKGVKLERLRRGDVITATLVVKATESWVEDVYVVRYEPPPDIPVAPPKESKVGEPVADFLLEDQDGKPLRLSDYHGHTLVLTFIYTRCPIPEFCPRTMQNFQALEQAIEEDKKLRDNARLLSVSFDVEFDRPEVLEAFGSAFVKDRGQGRYARWKLATGTKEAVGSLGRFFGLVVFKEDGQFSHSMVTVVIGPDGKLVLELQGADWSVEEALQAMRDATSARRPRRP
ncbi:MAG: SCO family protein [Vicinamibacteria bacterium]|nr:SCO family protein [Vicinamibacteria bacterium]